MKNYILNALLICSIVAKSIICYSQNNNYISVQVRYSDLLPSNDSTHFSNDRVMDSILNHFRVYKYALEYPGMQTADLYNYCYIYSNGNIDSLKNALEESEKFISVRIKPFSIINCSNPTPAVNDPWVANNLINNWALDLVEANCAWSITKGDSNIIVGMADTDFDTVHEDLHGKIISIWGNTFSPGGCPRHGTKTSGIVTARTNNNLGIASLGYNVKVAGYRAENQYWDSIHNACSGNPTPALLAAYNSGRRIINVSWTSTGLDYPAAL